MLYLKSSEQAISYLLSYLPLFNKKINDLKPLYVKLLARIYNDALVKCLSSVSSYNEYFHLLIIASIHPAFSKEEQNCFENTANQIQKKFQSTALINSNNYSHHDYNMFSNEEINYDVPYIDEGFSSQPSILSNLVDKQNSNDNDINNIYSNVSTPSNRYLMSKTQVSNCTSAPPNIATNYIMNNNNNNSSNSNNSENDEDTNDDEDNDDDDDDEDEDDENQKCNPDTFDLNNNHLSPFSFGWYLLMANQKFKNRVKYIFRRK